MKALIEFQLVDQRTGEICLVRSTLSFPRTKTNSVLQRFYQMWKGFTSIDTVLVTTMPMFSFSNLYSDDNSNYGVVDGVRILHSAGALIYFTNLLKQTLK